MAKPLPNFRQLRIIAQDPSVRTGSKILTDQVSVPAEELDPGPGGHRVQVIDYDASTKTLYKRRPGDAYRKRSGEYVDPFENASDSQLLNDPHFHAQNVYAIVMRTLARFEFALGRRVSWSFDTHQLKVAPHAFADANAFYSTRDEALMFGYFAGRSGTVFTCLSHDIVAHETTHAMLDGLRERYVDPSSPDQAAFHEGFADVVALLSVFSLEGVVRAALSGIDSAPSVKGHRRPTYRTSQLTLRELRESALLGLAEQMGQELSDIRGGALRQSALLKPSPSYYRDDPHYLESHTRGEILVAAIMNAFLKVWTARLAALDPTSTGFLDRERVVEEGAKAADHLLTITIRALDYCMPVHIEFGDYLSGMLTADHEVCPDDAPYHYRKQLRESFAEFGIKPGSPTTGPDAGIWQPPDGVLVYDRTHFESLKRDVDEVFRFIWENRDILGVAEDVYTRVLSVRPCLRIAPDGFARQETVAEYMQLLTVEASELSRFHIDPGERIPPDTPIVLQGGGTLIFDEFGRLKFNVRHRLDHPERQSRRIAHLWRVGFIRANGNGWRPHRFSELHRKRALGTLGDYQEEWH